MTIEISSFLARRTILMALGLAAVLILTIACSSSENGAVADPVADPEPVDDFDAGDASLVIYSGRSESLIAPLIKRFEEATGIDAKVNYGGTGALAATLLEEGDRSPADVFFAQDPGGLGAIIELLDPIPDELIGRVPDWARSPENMWVGVSGRARTVVYNTENVSPEDLPDTLDGFTDPKWKGRIGWAPTNGSFQAMVTGMRLIWGEDRTREWLEGIVANDPRVYAKNTPTVAAAGTGEIDIGFVNHYYLHRFLAEEGEEFRARNHFLSGGGPGSIVLAAGVGILETAENRTAAEQFVKFLLGPVAQGYFAGQTYEYPLVEGVATSRLLPPLDTLARPDIDLSRLGDLEATQALMRSAGVLP